MTTSTSTSTYSFYIPRVSRTYTEEEIKIIFSSVLMIGDVKRVDFVSINKKFQRAFVHMDMFYDVETTNGLRETVFEQGRAVRVYPGQLLVNPLLEKVEQKGGLKSPRVEQNFCSLFPKKRLLVKRIYWILLKNNNPVPETTMNLPQIVAQMNTMFKILNEKGTKPLLHSSPRPIGSLLDKMFDNPFSFLHSTFGNPPLKKVEPKWGFTGALPPC